MTTVVVGHESIAIVRDLGSEPLPVSLIKEVELSRYDLFLTVAIRVISDRGKDGAGVLA